MSADAPAEAPTPLAAALLDGSSARLSVTQRFGTAVPRHGLSPSWLRAFVKEYAGRTLQPSEEERNDPCAAAPVALRFEDLTTTQVVERIIKPSTVHTGGSYAELLQEQVRA